MRRSRIALSASLLAFGGALAQVAEEATAPPVPVDIMTGVATPAQPSLKIDVRPRTYMQNGRNDATTNIFNNGSALGVYRSDPRLVGGIELAPNVAVEVGYTNLVNRGVYLADDTRFDDVGGVHGFNGFLATKFTLPLGEKLQAYSKIGVAHSQYIRPTGPGANKREIDIGPYLGLGMQYQLGKNAVPSGRYERYGNSEQKWGSRTNNNGVRVRLDVQF